VTIERQYRRVLGDVSTIGKAILLLLLLEIGACCFQVVRVAPPPNLPTLFRTATPTPTEDPDR